MVYKVMVDLDEVDLNALFTLTKDKGLDLCVANDSLYFHSKDSRKVQISNIMKKINSTGFVIKPLMEKPTPVANDFASTWCCEKMTQEETEKFEAEHQEELQTMLDNVERVRQDLITKNKVKEEAVDAAISGDQKATRSSEENTD